MPDPYRTLGVSRSASDAELRAAYRKLVLLHHPDHNNGSAESARRFEEVQDAYAEVRRLRQAPGGGDRIRARPAGTASGTSSGGARGARSSGADPGLDSRLAAMERELKAARDARERAVRQAHAAQQQAMRDARAAADAIRGGKDRDRPSDEELGYISTDDSLSKILDDAISGFGERLSEARDSATAKRVSESIDQARKSPTGKRLSDVIDDLASKLTGEPPDR
ncbi:MAG: DnaJ domain-containing protein [Solirubrobacteraceae bacterium]